MAILAVPRTAATLPDDRGLVVEQGRYGPVGRDLIVRAHRWSGDADGADPTMSLGQLLDQAEQRINGRQYRAALALLDTALDTSPGCASALILAARCHLLLGDAPRALDVARQALRHARGSETAGAAWAIFADCVRAASGERLEAARVALRRRELRRAIALLDEIASVRAEDADFADIRAYAHDRLIRSLPPAARAAMPMAGRHRLTPMALQKVLAWLTREELDEGAAALNNREYVRAAEVLDRINQIDHRGGQAAYLQATAIYRSVVTGLARPTPPALAAAKENLRRAATLTDRASVSADYREPAKRLRAEIDAAAQRIAGASRVRPVNALVERYNLLVARYTGGTITMFEASNARRSLAGLSTEVANLRHQYDARSGEGRTLADLAAAIIGLQRQLSNVV